MPPMSQFPPSLRGIRVKQVCKISGFAPATAWRLSKNDATFPKPFKLSRGVTVWDEAEVVRWMEEKKNSGRVKR